MRVIEVTGVAGVGKSYVLSKLSQNPNIVLDTALIKAYKLNDLRLGILFLKQKKSLKMLWLMIQIAFKLKMSLFHQINFIRNSIKKFGKEVFIHHQLTKMENIIIVDEGISHLYQNIITDKNDDNEALIALVDQLIVSVEFNNEIMIINANETTIYHRLFNRGHKRLKSGDEIKKFIIKSQTNIQHIEEKFNHVFHIQNDEDGDLETELNTIWK
jgi:dephospho-CoA kinase